MIDRREFSNALFAALATVSVARVSTAHASERTADRIEGAVDLAIRPLMAKHRIPGMAVGVTIDGRPHVFDYGLASVEGRRPVGPDTLFEIGSVSKTFTAALASQAQVSGRLSLSNKVGRHLPSLRGSEFGEVTLLQLGTHTPGGLPLQVPEGIGSIDQLMQYFRAWRPTYAPGSTRTYANPGIGLLGLITARRLDQDFAVAMDERIFTPLGMKHSHIHVPADRRSDYAQGYARNDAPVRMSPGMLSSEAYGIKTTAADMLRFLQAQMSLGAIDSGLQRALVDTHTGYFEAGAMTQDLIWEQYAYPVTLQTLLEGNSSAMIFEPTPVTRIDPPQPPRDDVLLNKTGSTSGFGAYAAFVPRERIGIVLLANRNYPIEDRVTVAHRLLQQLHAAR